MPVGLGCIIFYRRDAETQSLFETKFIEPRRRGDAEFLEVIDESFEAIFQLGDIKVD
jgi:hypothetical protein